MTPVPELIDSHLEHQGHVAVLTFQRHDVRNALTGTHLIADLLKTIHWLNVETEMVALIITGEGSAFSSGGNIKEMEQNDGLFSGESLDILQGYRREIQRLPLAMESCEVPLIAAVNGHAMGVGFDLVCMCDLRLASSRAKVGEVFVNLGLIPGDGGAYFLPRVVGYQKAAELTLTGRVIDAAEAQSIGVFLDVVEPDDLLPHALKLAEEMASKPPHAVRLAKRLLKMGQRADLQSVLDLSASYNSMLHKTEGHVQAVKALQQGRSKKLKK